MCVTCFFPTLHSTVIIARSVTNHHCTRGSSRHFEASLDFLFDFKRSMAARHASRIVGAVEWRSVAFFALHGFHLIQDDFGKLAAAV